MKLETKRKILSICAYIISHILALAFTWGIFMSLEYKWSYNAMTIFVSYFVMPIFTLMIIITLFVNIIRVVRKGDSNG